MSLRQVVTIAQQPEGTTHYALDSFYRDSGQLIGAPPGMQLKGTLCNRNALAYAVTEGDCPVIEEPTCQRCADAAALEERGMGKTVWSTRGGKVSEGHTVWPEGVSTDDFQPTNEELRAMR